MKLFPRPYALPLVALALLTAPAGVASAAPGYADAVLADEPVAYFRLNETEGGSVADAAGDHEGMPSDAGVDLSVAGPTGAGFGPDNSAAAFDRGENGVIRLGEDLTATLEGAPAVTMEFWLEVPTGIQNDFQNENLTALFVGSAKGDNTTTGANASIRNLRLRFGGRSKGADGYQAGAVEKLEEHAGGFVHVVGVVDFAEGEFRTYFNGELVDTSEADFKAETFQPGDRPAAIGAVLDDAREAVNGLDGTIDEVAFYNRALSAERIAAHHTAGTAPAEPG